MAAVKLIGMHESPFVRRVEIALSLKGVDYEYIKEDIWNKSPLLLKYNPVHKKVPVLVHNDKPISESLVIVEYIDETWEGTPILPEDPYERAMARFWAKFIDDKCCTAIWKSIFLKGEEQEKAIEEAKENFKILNNELKDKKFFGGDNIGLPDIAANVIALWLGVLEEFSGVKLMSEEKYPRLFEWVEEYLKCNIVNENMPERERLLAYFQDRFPSFDASN